MNKIEIIPAILPNDFEELKDKLNKIKKAYDILNQENRFVQIDVCDSSLGKSFDIFKKEIESLREKTLGIDLEIDFIAKDFKVNLEDWISLGVQRVIIHHFNLSRWSFLPWNFSFEKFIKKYSGKIEIGLGVDLNLPLKKIVPYLNKVDFIQFMGIENIGQQGEVFKIDVLKKIDVLRKLNSKIIISVDGGVKLENAQSIIGSGVNRLVVGSAIMGNNTSIEDIIKNMRDFYFL